MAEKKYKKVPKKYQKIFLNFKKLFSNCITVFSILYSYLVFFCALYESFAPSAFKKSPN
jgi:hypothetical protein